LGEVIMPKIAILITTFLRDSALYKTVQSIVDNCPDNCTVLIADQGYQTDEKIITYDYFKSQIPCEVFYLPFDCGLSYARNFLVNKAKELGYEYCLVSSDSIQFTKKYNFEPIVELLETTEEYGLCGFDLENSKCPWEYKIDIQPNGIHLIPSEDILSFNGKIYRSVEICRNIFLAKTNSINGLWDNEMKLGEHELAFIEYKKRGYKVFWTDSIKFKKNNAAGGDEYKEYRKRLGDYLKLLRKKLNISGWVVYDK
jgi:glycosyltransferase involved in cell wall biosynthesis